MPSALVLVSAVGVLTWCIVEMIRRQSVRWRLLDHPNTRSSHVVPTSRLGGLGLAVVLLCGLAALVLTSSPGAAVEPMAGQVWALIVTGTAVAGISLVDDLWSIPAAARLIAHLSAGTAIVWSTGSVDAFPVWRVHVTLFEPMATMLTVLWVAGFINAYNFMDGIDGIAGGQALVAGMGWMVIGVAIGQQLLVLCGVLLVGVASGFLAHNWSPASIFMGDAGSALLGLLLACLPWVLGGPTLWWPTVLLVWPFVFDTMLTLVRRLLRGERVWLAHRSHLYQRLVDSGVSHATVSASYMGLSCLGLLAALAAVRSSPLLELLTLGAIVVAACALYAMVARIERAASPVPQERV